jgi:uncharacterized membrane protein YkoI
MKSSKVLALSVFLTAVILVVIGAVTSNVLANKAAVPTATPQLVQAYQQREADYQQLLKQANEQLAKANTELQDLQNQVNQHVQPTAVQPGAEQTKISPDKAAEIGSQAAGPGEDAQKTPDLVDFQGKTAFEVVFDKGIVYVDATTGEILFNGTVPQEINADKAAQIASTYLGIKGILKIDQVTINNIPLFRVIFKNGTLAWVDRTGQISDVQLPGVTIHASAGSGGGSSAAPAPVTAPSNGGGNSGGSAPHEDGGNDGHESD